MKKLRCREFKFPFWGHIGCPQTVPRHWPPWNIISSFKILDTSTNQREFVPWPGGSVSWSTVPCTKRLWFNAQSGHIPRLWGGSRVRARKGGSQSMFLSQFFFPSLPPSLSLKSVNLSSGEDLKNNNFKQFEPFFLGSVQHTMHMIPHREPEYRFSSLGSCAFPSWQMMSQMVCVGYRIRANLTTQTSKITIFVLNIWQ